MTDEHKHSDLTSAEASQMWDSLREGFQNIEKQIIAIIQAKAWEPLGFETFTEAWSVRMNGIRLATTEVRAAVVYQMLSDGLSDEDVVLTSGVGDQAVAALRRQKANGVPASAATTTVRRHARKLPSAPSVLHVKLSEDERSRWRAVAEAAGKKPDELASQVIRDSLARREGVMDRQRYPWAVRHGVE